MDAFRRPTGILAALAIVTLVAGCDDPTRADGGPTGTSTTADNPIPVEPDEGTGAGAGPPVGSGTPKLQRLAGGFTEPVHVTAAPDGDGLWVVERAGRVIATSGQGAGKRTVLDITERVGADGGEQGLLSIVPPPADSSRPMYAYYTDTGGTARIVSFGVRSDGSIDAADEQLLIAIRQPFANHNGGQLALHDNLLYIGVGDGGSAGDPEDNGQDPTTLLGTILRVQPTPGAPRPYAIPAGNPFAAGGGKPEILAIGARNPWRFSFDAETGAMLIGDVGQNAVEEVTMLAPARYRQRPARNPINLEWPLAEGTADFRPGDPAGPGKRIGPALEYGHDAGCSITGGHVYRGPRTPLVGLYIFADYCDDRIWWAQTRRSDLGPAQTAAGVGGITSFGEGADRRLYAVTAAGELWEVIPR